MAEITPETLAAVLRGRVIDVLDSPHDDPRDGSRTAYLAFPDDFAENVLDEIADLD